MPFDEPLPILNNWIIVCAFVKHGTLPSGTTLPGREFEHGHRKYNFVDEPDQVGMGLGK